MVSSLPRRVTLDELVALNDEIITLTRAGVPLEHGLLAAARDAGGRVGQLGETLAERLGRGERWENVLRDLGQVFPPVYCAVVEAGLRTGKLPMAVETLSTSLRRLAELNRTLRLALFYPLLLLGMAYAFFVAGVLFVLPTLLDLYVDMGQLPASIHDLLRAMIDQVPVWAPIPPIVVGVLLLASAIRYSWRRRSWRGPRLLVGGVARTARLATFTELLTLLVVHQTPLDRALELAGQSSGDTELCQDSVTLAEAIRSGARELPRPVRRGVPVMLRAILLTEPQGPRLQLVLRREADAALRRARLGASRLAFRLPLFTAIVFGGMIVTAFAVTALGPWYWILLRMGRLVEL